MIPMFFSVGSMSLNLFPLFVLLSVVVWSFLYWRRLRDLAIDEEKIYSMMFFVALVSFGTARLFFVMTHWTLFSETLLRVVTIWIEPGLSLYGALIGAILTIIFLSFQYGLRLGTLLDAAVRAFSVSFIIGSLGSFFSGLTIGVRTYTSFGILYKGFDSLRHPIQVYDISAVFIILFLLILMQKKHAHYLLDRPGLYALWFFFLFSLSQFFLEFLRDGSVYLGILSINQWICVAIFAESFGMLYVRGGGKEFVRRIYYAVISNRIFKRNQKEA